MSADQADRLENILESIPEKFGKLKILITSGPTCEDIDDVRFITNRSSGKMGAAIAKACITLEHQPLIISGPVNISYPDEVPVYGIRSALEMFNAVKNAVEWCDVLIMAAAVADYRPAEKIDGKMHKSEDNLTIKLVRTPDILSELKTMTANKIVVGFSLDSFINTDIAREKIAKKNMSFIVVNTTKSFDTESTDAVIIDKDGNTCSCPALKSELAGLILQKCEEMTKI